MDQKKREQEALFRLSIIGQLVNRKLNRGELRKALQALSPVAYTGPDGEVRKYSWRTLETWVLKYRKGGFEALLPKGRKDRGTVRALPDQIVNLIVELKRKNPQSSASLILRTLELKGLLAPCQVSLSTVSRILRKADLSGPRLELLRPARYRWVASHCNELWQGDALHGPKLLDPKSSKKRKTIIFGLLDDRSRLAVRLWAGFAETQEAFLRVFYEAMCRRGMSMGLLLDNHGSFRGHDLQVLCARLKVQLKYTRPRDGPGKGAIERFWRTLRQSLLRHLDPTKVLTVDDLNLRLVTWAQEQYNQRPHCALGGRTPAEVWAEEADSVRWVEDYAKLEELFVGRTTRRVLNDSTLSFRGTIYEVPVHLRGKKVSVLWSLLKADRVWVEDSGRLVPIKPVDPEGNASRLRKAPPEDPPPNCTGGLNIAELLLDHALGRKRPKEKGEENE